MAQGARRKRRSRRRHGGTGLPRGVAMGSLLLAAVIGLGWFFRSVLMTGPGNGRHAVQEDSQVNGQTNGQADGKAGHKPGASDKTRAGNAKPEKAGPGAAAGTAPEQERFEFYDMLPEAKVDVATQRPVPPAVRPPVSEPGTYVIQAGAYPDFAEADKVKARLALLGIVAVIQKVESNGTEFNRVRIGPIRDLAELNLIRDRLRDRHIDYLLIPIDE